MIPIPGFSTPYLSWPCHMYYVTIRVLIISAKWTEWNCRIYCFHFCLTAICVYVCVHSVPLVWMGGMTYCSLRNVFDLCVKSWHYFHTDKIVLETSFYWLSGDIRSKWGFMRNVQKCNMLRNMQNGCSAAPLVWRWRVECGPADMRVKRGPKCADRT